MLINDFYHGLVLELENFESVENTEKAPFTSRRSYHFWAHELMAISAHQPESLWRIRYPCGHGGPNPLRDEFIERGD